MKEKDKLKEEIQVLVTSFHHAFQYPTQCANRLPGLGVGPLMAFTYFFICMNTEETLADSSGTKTQH